MQSRERVRAHVLEFMHLGLEVLVKYLHADFFVPFLIDRLCQTAHHNSAIRQLLDIADLIAEGLPVVVLIDCAQLSL